MFLHSTFSRILLIISISLCAINALAVETDPLELKEGTIDKKTGTKIEKITINEKENLREVTLSVPAATGKIEEIIVTAPAPKKKPVIQIKPFKFLKDYEHDRYGLVIYLGKNEELPLLFYFHVPPQ